MSTIERTDLAKVQAGIEDALRAAWAEYATTGDWYDAAGIGGMAEVVMRAISPLVEEVGALRREITGPLSTDEVARRGWRFGEEPASSRDCVTFWPTKENQEQ